MSSHTDSQPTSGLRPFAGITQRTKALMQRTSRNDSPTTSPTDVASEKNELLPAGRGGGVFGAIPTPSASVLAVFALPAQAVMLAHSLVPLLDWQETSQFSDHGFEGVRVHDVAVRPGADRQYVGQCLARAEILCEPCDSQFAAMKLAELRVLTAHRARDGVDVELMAGAYTQRLAQYPTDVVAAACDAWSNREEFWPTWAELKAECDKRMRGRVQIRDALRAAA